MGCLAGLASLAGPAGWRRLVPWAEAGPQSVILAGEAVGVRAMVLAVCLLAAPGAYGPRPAGMPARIAAGPRQPAGCEGKMGNKPVWAVRPGQGPATAKRSGRTWELHHTATRRGARPAWASARLKAWPRRPGRPQRPSRLVRPVRPPAWVLAVLVVLAMREKPFPQRRRAGRPTRCSGATLGPTAVRTPAGAPKAGRRAAEPPSRVHGLIYGAR